MIPKNITKEHLIKAILEIDETGIRKGRHSSTYDIGYNGNLYPPKLVISIANRFANGVELDPNSFAGGKGTDAFKLLEKNGFIVNEKTSILNLNEIQKGIELLCNTSAEVDGFYQSDENIVEALNKAKIDDLKKCAEYYSSRNGVVIDIRKELINRLIKKEVFTVKSLTELIEKYKKGNEKKFRSYKKTFSIVFPAITFYGHNEQRNFVESFTSKLIDDLSLRDNVKEVSFDFQGVRQQGSDFYWVAIYNREQKNQSTGNQFFFEFHKGKIGYSFYRHSDKSYLKPKVTLKPEDFNYEKMLLYFNESKDLLLEDIPNNKENSVNETELDYKKEKMNLPLNTILYGPPGTGKTYNTINYALNVLGVDIENLSRKEIVDIYHSKIDSEEIIFTTFHQSISYEDFIEGIKPNTKNGKVNYKVEDGLFKEFCSTKSFFNINDSFGSRSQYSIISVNKSLLRISRDSGVVDISMAFINEMLHLFFSNEISLDSFKTSNRDKLRELFSTKWDKYLFGYDSMYKGILEYVEQKGQVSKKLKKVFIIDEINRGNISNVFGELITLIEEDKRIDTINYTPIKLPYSKELFGVPNNLYIIGTMNTADRSVEALDTALRRRFSFIEMNPDPSKLSSEEFKCDGIDLEALLAAINGRIEKLLDKDYCIGHSYFMTIKNRQQPLEEIKTIFQNKILPLLQEYFYGDWGKIMLVIGKKFIDKKVETIKFLSNGLADEYEEYDEKPIYNFTDSKGWTIESFTSIYE